MKRAVLLLLGTLSSLRRVAKYSTAAALGGLLSMVATSLQAEARAQAAPLPATTGDGHLVFRSHLFALPDGAVGYIPASASPHPPLLVLLHGAGHRQIEMVEHLEGEADKRGILLLAPDSRGPTWDAVLDAEGPPPTDSPLAVEMEHRFRRTRDADRVEKAISNLEQIVPVDEQRIVLAGSSDGATFALAMGMSRAYAFAAVIAWSPGIAIKTEDAARGRRVLISHGHQDQILNFKVTCSDIVPLVQSEGGNVTFLPFDGGHEAPPGVKDAFLDEVFGPAPGQTFHPLPSSARGCAPLAERSSNR